MGKETEAGAAYAKGFGESSSEELLLRRKSFEDGGLRGFWEHDLRRELTKASSAPAGKPSCELTWVLRNAP